MKLREALSSATWTLTTLYDGISEQSSIAQHNRSKFPIVLRTYCASHTNLIYRPEYSGSVPISTLSQHADSTWWQLPRTLPQSGSRVNVLTESDRPMSARPNTSCMQYICTFWRTPFSLPLFSLSPYVKNHHIYSEMQHNPEVTKHRTNLRRGNRKVC